MFNRSYLVRAAQAALFLISLSASAGVINDPANDFLGTYVGTKGGDLDVIKAEVFYTGSSFIFTSSSSAAIGTTPGATFVWGIDRGAGTSRFPGLAPGVLFDSVVTINPGGISAVRDLIGGAATNLGPTDVTIAGTFLSATVAANLLPSQGLTPGNYTVNLWPRLGAGNNNQIADFAPDNSNALVTSTPEPSSAILLLSSLGALAVAGRRRLSV